MKGSLVGVLGVTLWIIFSWIGGEIYYETLRLRGGWRIEGKGALWDSAWIMQHVAAQASFPPAERVWRLQQELKDTRLFSHITIYYTGRGEGRLRAITREPAARVMLPLRQYYLSWEGERLPLVRPLPVPLISAPRWDSTAFAHFLSWWKLNPWYSQATSLLYQDPRGVWHGYLEIAPETFVLGRTPHLPTALSQWDVYLRSLQPKLGGRTCKSVLLYIPKQIVCQETEKI
jgi:hypothetical protein